VLSEGFEDQQLLDAMPGMVVVVGRDGRIARANRRLATFLGAACDALIDERLADRLPPLASEALEQALESGLATQNSVVRLVGADGTSRAMVVDTVPLQDASEGVAGVMLCVRPSGDAALEAVLTQREREHRDILENTTDVLLRLSDEGRYLAVLTGGDRLVLPPDQLMGKTIHELLPTEAAADVQRVIDATLDSGEMQEYEYSLEVDGRLVWFSARVVPEGRTKVLWAARDVTAWRAADEERRALEVQMLRAQKLESLGVLAGGVAHDFNNLLVGVLGNAELVLSSTPPESSAAEALVHIREAAMRAAELCRQLLTYTGQEAAHRESLNMSELVRGITALLKTPGGTQRVHYDLMGDLPPVRADATQLRQITMNLVTNATEALEDRPGTVRITTGRAYCTAEDLARSRVQSEAAAGDYVFVEVEDDGAGMSPEVRDRMFDPFFTTKFTGRGLGMAAVLGIVRGHDGAIFVRSEEGQGTCVRVLFPIAADVEPAEDSTAGQSRGTASATVLVVDDDNYVRSFLRRFLEQDGHAVVDVGDGREAIERFSQQPQTFDLVLLDLTMPGWSGGTVLEELRNVDPSIPIVLSSGYPAERAGHLLELPGVQFLPKPYRPEELRECISRARRANPRSRR